jgi:membrane-associated protease RseP (regulator of RpoE activity)
MADELDTTDGGPRAAEARSPGRSRWLRWGSVYVDIEPPAAPNPWTTPGWGSPASPELVPLVAPTSGSRRNALLFGLAAVVAALLGFLLVAAFTRHDRSPVLEVAPSTTRARPTTTTTRPAPVPSTSPGTAPGPSSAPTSAAPPVPTSAVPTAPSSTVAGATTTIGRAGGPITIPEGVPPSTPAAPAAPSTTVAPPSTTTTSAGPRAFLGVTVEETFGEGALVIDVLPSTGAAAAGLLPGDVITAIDATAVASPDELGAAIVAHRPGDSVTVSVLRNGATVTVRATLGVR